MNAIDFANWLQGCLDVLETKTLNAKQVEMIREKLSEVDGHQTKLKNNITKNSNQILERPFLPPGYDFQTISTKLEPSYNMSTVMHSNYDNWPK